MWARTVEVGLAIWLAMSPFVFGYAGVPVSWWAIDFGVAALVTCASLASFWTPLRRAHIVTLCAGLGLALHGYLAGGHPSPPPLQNHLVTGLLIVMFAVIPSASSRPPMKWQAFYARAEDRSR